MKKQLFLIATLFLLVFSACTKNEGPHDNQQQNVLVEKANPEAIPQGNSLEKLKLDQVIISKLESNNDFHWEDVDMKTLWSAVVESDQSVAIGYQPADAGDISAKIHTVNVNTVAYKQVHDALKSLILEELNKSAGTSIKWNDILIEDDPILPIITLRLTDKTVLTRLRNLQNVRYLEPMDYWPNDVNRAGSGCDGSTYGLNASDYTTVTPSALVPWNFNNQNIPTAWNTSQGQGITIGVIDAGLSSSQSLLGSLFNNGDSNIGRSVSTDYTLGSSAFNSCTHGTSMCALAAGPRNNQNATTGVAYKSGLHFIRAANDVVLDGSSEKTATKNAFIKMGNRSDVRIISLSMGTPFGSGVLKDGADYANNLGKTIFAAAGTSYSWTSWWGVIYPAAYSSCIAVTGVKENGSKCASCHDGSSVMYTITMERSSNSSRNSLSLAPSGSTPTYIGGSSCATATAAGIAALVLSTKPNMNKTQLMTCLTNTAQFYPVKNSSKGYGNLNASAAVNYAIANY
ncbi:MAG: S8 family serine peptidase [Bacteroidetes bacterium]|nr:S8 family serine peptidase [Bacteroidota bacterium]